MSWIDNSLKGFNQIDVVIKKETHNLEYAIIIPVALFILILLRYYHVNIPPEYSAAIFGVSLYTPLTKSFIDIYSIYKSQGEYIYKIEIQSYNIFLELFLGTVSYFITQITMYILGYTATIFSISSIIYFIKAYIGITIVRFIDRKLLKEGGYILISFGFIFTFLFLLLFTSFILSF